MVDTSEGKHSIVALIDIHCSNDESHFTPLVSGKFLLLLLLVF